MSEGDESTFKAVELAEEAQEAVPTEKLDPGLSESNQLKTAGPNPSTGQNPESKKELLEQYKMRRFFVLRPGAFEQAIEDIQSLVDKEEDGTVQSVWLLAEVDHWNNEKERIVLINDHSLLIGKYDFMMLKCEQVQRIPLNLIDRVCHGAFSFPPRSLIIFIECDFKNSLAHLFMSDGTPMYHSTFVGKRREGEGMRVYWDRLREPSFISRWNPFSTDYPYCTFTYHPVKDASKRFATLCELQNFREQLTQAAQKAHAKKPVPGKANGVLVLNQPILIETYVGLMSVIGNQNKLGYCLARGNIGF